MTESEPIKKSTDEVQHDLDSADHATKGATSARTLLEPQLPAIHPDDLPVDLEEEEYPRQ